MKILLAPKWELAKDLVAEATVEAEYGENVLKGIIVTLAHHVKEYKSEPAPCNRKDVPLLPNDATIVVSHIDLDTVGGIMALMGLKTQDDAFWAAAEFIDLNGPHHGYKFPAELPKLQAYWAWNSAQPRARYSDEVVDVTETVMKHIDAVQKILSGDQELIEQGQKWAAETQAKIEACLVEEDDKVRVFATDDVFCGAAYFSPNLGKVVPVIIAMNTKFGAITVSVEDGGKTLNAKELVQSLWGSEAGGHAGIAGSPRGKRMGLKEFVRAVEAVRQALN